MSLHKCLLPLLVAALLIDITPTVNGQCTGGCDATGGECIGTICYCKAGYFGPTCATSCGTCSAPKVCITASTCGDCPTDCGAPTAGTCSVVNITPTCKCNTGYYTAGCSSNYCDRNPCKHSGTCTAGVAGYTCACTDTWTGPTCDIAAVKCGTGKCITARKGDCVADVCYCNPLFMGADCGTACAACATAGQVCNAAGTCAACNPVCAATGSCATVDTAPTCKCNTGYSGATCADTAVTCGTGKCTTGKGDCVAGVCYCKPLFMGADCATDCGACTNAGEVCNAAATCAACNPACAATGSCLTVGTTPTCFCNAGYTGATCDSGVTSVVPSVLAVALLILLRLL